MSADAVAHSASHVLSLSVRRTPVVPRVANISGGISCGDVEIGYYTLRIYLLAAPWPNG